MNAATPKRPHLVARFRRHLAGVVALGLCVAVTNGCAHRSYRHADHHYFSNAPERLEAEYAEALSDTGRNALIGVEKLLSSAMLRGDWRRAEDFAVRASTLVNIYVADDGGERDALSLLGREKSKPFKGEPHEQVMADYYLGVLRFMRRDFEGALAAFRSAMQKDRGMFELPVEVEQARRRSDNARRFLYVDDYSTLKFLAALCYQELDEGEEARRLLDEAKALDPSLSDFFEYGFNRATNAIVLIEAGTAPRKRKTGPQGSVLGYSAGSRVELREVTLGSTNFDFAEIDDLHYQASTLGGRQVDDLNSRKAEKREALRAAGYFTTVAGYFLAAGTPRSRGKTDDRLRVAGLIAFAAGIGTMLFADLAFDPSADTRAWSLLPGQLILAFGRVPRGQHRLRIEASGYGSAASQEWSEVRVRDGRNLFWTRLLPGRRGGVWPDADAPVERGTDGRPVESEVLEERTRDQRPEN